MNDKIAGYMKFKKLTQAAMAEKLGITRETFNKKLNGKQNFTMHQFIQMAKILEVKTDDLI